MKNSKYLLLLFLSISISFYSCDDDDDDAPAATAATSTGPTQNIAEIAIGDSRTDSLVVALSQRGLVPTFQGSGNFTVFAPTNQAFRDLLSTLNLNSIAEIDTTLLTNVLLYHVLGDKVMAGDLTNETYATTLNNQGPDAKNTVLEIDVDAAGGVKINNNATVDQANIEATNGVIHIIDAVVMPRNVLQLALNDERFSTLVSAVSLFGTTFTSALEGPGPLTVFAPTNTAFQALLDSRSDWNVLGDIPTAILEAVLKYHVVTIANVQSGQLTQGQIVPTLNTTSSLTVDLTNGAQLMTSDTSQAAVNIIVTDVQGTNGVIHAVESVLLP